jgi:catalase
MSEINHDLYRNERYKFGTKELEEDEFEKHVTRVRAVQEQLAIEHFAGERKRVFHAKLHACLLGTLTLREDRPSEVRHGIFANDGIQRYNVLARFSNGLGMEAHDLMPDVRGLALKIFGVNDSADTPTSRGGKCVDWLMTNSTNPFGRDQEEFVEFMEANAGSILNPVNLVKFAAYCGKHPEVFSLLLKATARVIPSLATEQYWSGHPYLLGNEIAMKFNVAPEAAVAPSMGNTEASRMNSLVQQAIHEVDEIEGRLKRWFDVHRLEASPLHPDYLRRDLLHRLERAPLRYTLSVQLEKDPNSTPIENTLVEWKESDSPSIPVADLELVRQSIKINSELLRFSPAHFISAHRPLGNLARGRLFTYTASQDGRAAATSEPDEEIVFQS